MNCRERAIRGYPKDCTVTAGAAEVSRSIENTVAGLHQRRGSVVTIRVTGERMQKCENAVGGQAIDRALPVSPTRGTSSIKSAIAPLGEPSSRTAAHTRSKRIEGRQ